jgi:hypothetical protein
MEQARRQRIKEEFEKLREIVDTRRPNHGSKMEQGDILEQMRMLFLDTEQRLRQAEAQLTQQQQNLYQSLCGFCDVMILSSLVSVASFNLGYNCGTNFNLLTNLSAQMNLTPEQILAYNQLLLNQIPPNNPTTTTPTTPQHPMDDSGLGVTPN